MCTHDVHARCPSWSHSYWHSHPPPSMFMLNCLHVIECGHEHAKVDINMLDMGHACERDHWMWTCVLHVNTITWCEHEHTTIIDCGHDPHSWRHVLTLAQWQRNDLSLSDLVPSLMQYSMYEHAVYVWTCCTYNMYEVFYSITDFFYKILSFLAIWVHISSHVILFLFF